MRSTVKTSGEVTLRGTVGHAAQADSGDIEAGAPQLHLLSFPGSAAETTSPRRTVPALVTVAYIPSSSPPLLLCRASKVLKSLDPSHGFCLVTTQRPTSRSTASTASPIVTSRPPQDSSSYGSSPSTSSNIRNRSAQWAAGASTSDCRCSRVAVEISVTGCTSTDRK